MYEITVKPCDGSGGWVLQQKHVHEMRFMSGAKAEDAARRLVSSLADFGVPARATIMLRDGSLAGRMTRF